MNSSYKLLIGSVTALLALAGTVQSARLDPLTDFKKSQYPAESFASLSEDAEVDQAVASPEFMLDPKVGENIRMGDDPEELPSGRRAQAEPHIARSWNDPNLVVAVFQEGRFETGGAVGIGYAVSTNGGLSWNRKALMNITAGFGSGPFDRGSDPVVAFDLEDRAFINLVAFTTTGEILLSRSDDGGETFGQHISAYTDNWPDPYAHKNWIAIDTWPNSPHLGRIAVSFSLVGLAIPGDDILTTFSDDGGQTWSTAVALGFPHTFGPQPLFLSDGALAVIFWRWDGAGRVNERIEIALSPDGGATFQDPLSVVSNITRHDDPTTRDGVIFPSAATDRLAGVIGVAYQARVANIPRILFTKSIDRGRTWSPPIPVNDTPNGKSVFNPALAISPDGQHVTISFYDKRDGATLDFVDLYLAESFDGGDTWKPNIRLSSVSSDLRLAPVTSNGGPLLGDYQGITPALNFDAPAVAAWIDTRTGSPDPFAVRIQRTQGTTFETWRRLRYSPAELADPSISGESADGEGDGTMNLFEYVHATEPDIPSISPFHVVRAQDPQGGIIVSYERLAVISDLHFMWTGSENLTDWFNVEPLSEQSSIAEDPIMERVEARFSGDQHQLFLHLVAGVILRIDRHPRSQVVQPGDAVEFSVAAAGTGNLTYQWRLEGAVLVGATNASLAISNAQPAHAGDYSVIVQDSRGSISSDPATLTVLVPPIILEQPQNQTVTAGDTATFNVAVTNSATLPITYVWRRGLLLLDTQVLDLYSSTFSITNVQPADAGDYRVFVSNQAISGFGVISDLATLTVE